MKKLLETIYVLSPDSYVFHRNNNVCISIGGEDKVSVPITQVESIVFFGKNSLSTSLLGFCAEHGIALTFLSEQGRFYSRSYGAVNGNVLLRKRQYESLNDPNFCTRFARDILYAKMRNSKSILLRHARISRNEEVSTSLSDAAQQLSSLSQRLDECRDIDVMRGIEGVAASTYFAQFDNMLSDACVFHFESRSRRPPRNEVNAVLSFIYTLLTHEIASALETVGLDPAAGYLHSLRPGRPSLALDILEELRAPLCDRLTITLFNREQLSEKSFEHNSLAVYLNEKGKRTVIAQWRARKAEELIHPFLQEKIHIGLIPYVQSMLLARAFRGDLDHYPPFVWR